MEIGRNRGRFLDFLVHDSTIFDGVDERQLAKALELAYKKSNELGFQYVCMLNSDVIPYDESSTDFKKVFEESVRLRINNDTEDGCLLGFRF